METNSIVFFKNYNYHKPTFPPIIVAWQLSNPENIGNIMRLADNAGAEEVYVLGENFQLRNSSIKKTAGLSYNNIKLKFLKPEEFFKQISPTYNFVAIETCEDSTNIYTETLPQSIVLFLGNERNGLPDFILEKCKQKVHIPMLGKCKSMNVSHALAVALFEWQRQKFFSKKL